MSPKRLFNIGLLLNCKKEPNCRIEVEIIKDFLKSNYLDGIPWDDLNLIDIESGNEVSETDELFKLKVYQQILTQK